MGPPSKPKRGVTHNQMKKRQTPEARVAQRVMSVELQQTILNVFTQGFPVHKDTGWRSVMQEVKGHLFNRDFQTAFSKPQYLQVYALRWSAARALAYTDILTRSSRHAWFSPRQSKHALTADATAGSEAAESVDADAGGPPTRIACIGGGAGAEVVALAATSRIMNLSQKLEIVAIDIADWAEPIRTLHTSLTTPPLVPTPAEEEGEITNQAFIDASKFTVTFYQKDILDATPLPPDPQSQTLEGVEVHSLFSNITLCTMMFTLNELFSTSISKTTAMLLSLTDAMDKGSWLVVVDSPGSYSEIKLGKTDQTKKYPMKWLLDHTLLEMAGDEKWKKVEDEESVWFRLQDKEKLSYPLDLENCRYQIHAYQRR